MATNTSGRACEGKRAYSTKYEADGHVFALARAGASLKRIHAYHCTHCRLWHVGHKPRRRR